VSEYLRGGQQAAQLANRTRYFATRTGVELLRDDSSDLPVTAIQQEYVKRLVRSFPQTKELMEYEDYLASPTRGNAQDYIEQVRELYVDEMDDVGNRIDYIANRPGVQTCGEHGLWDSNGKVEVLSRVIEEVANHNGIVWTPVVSIRREDAERLGYTDAENWRALVNASIPDIARGYKIRPENLRWYAACHQKEKHVHIHMVVYSVNPKEGYLSKQGIQDIKSSFARKIFEQDMIAVYEKQTVARDELKRNAEELMPKLIHEIRNGTIQSEQLRTLVMDLSHRLQNTSGKKVYGYLPPASKRIVDAIVDEFAKDPRVAAAYDLWCELRHEICKTYNQIPPERVPLSQQKEFKPVRNMVIRETMALIEERHASADPVEDEPKVKAVESPAFSAEGGTRSAQHSYDHQDGFRSAAVGDAVIRMLHHIGRIFQDNTSKSGMYAGLQIDRKRRKKLQEKRRALGHKADDHEEPVRNKAQQIS